MSRIRPQYALAAVVASLLFGFFLAWLASFGTIVASVVEMPARQGGVAA